MKKSLFVILGSIFFANLNPAFADDWIIKSGSVFTRDNTSTSDLLSQDGTEYTTLVDIDCTNIFKMSTNGSKIGGAACLNRLIDKHNMLGKSVAATAAMNTAMSSLPESSPEAKYTCGLGTGGNSGTFAVSAGCASNFTERLSVNTGGSIALQDSQDYGSGTIENYGVKVGFLYKFGEIKKPIQISNNFIKNIEDKIESLASSNKKIQEENKQLKELVAFQNQRLQSLEKIALNKSNSQDLATIKMP